MINFGAILSPPDDRDYPVRSIVPAVELPKSVRLDDQVRGMRDQGNCGTCVGKSGATIASALHETDLSSLFIYGRSKEVDGIPDEEGTYPRVALKVMQKEGACLNATLPYSALTNCLRPPNISAVMADEASKYVIGAYARAYSNYEIKQALANGHLVMGVAAIYDNFINCDSDQVITGKSGQFYGHHAFVFCGYDDSKGFRCVNSWGKWWGDEGYFWLDYSFTSDPNLLPEAWVVSAGDQIPKGSDSMLLEKFMSRKFILAVVSGILVILNEGLGWNIPTETIMSFVILILGYLFVEGAVDVVKVIKDK